MTVDRIMLLALIGLALKSGAKAQPALGWHVGAAWTEMAQPNGENTAMYSGRLVPSAGLAFEVPITNSLSLMPEVAYRVRGARESFTFPRHRSGIVWRLTYTDINALGTFRFGGDGVRPHFLLGPSFGLLNSAWRLHLHDNDVIRKESLDVERMKLSRTQFSLIAGAGITFRVGGHRLMVDGRYAHGFTDLLGAAVETDMNGVVTRALSGYERTFSLDFVFLLTIPEAESPR